MIYFFYFCSTDFHSDVVENSFSLVGGGDHSDVMPRQYPAASSNYRSMHYALNSLISHFIIVFMYNYSDSK